MTHCYICGRGQDVGESYFSNGRRDLCTDCADTLSLESLELLTGAEGSRALLHAIGFWRACD